MQSSISDQRIKSQVTSFDVKTVKKGKEKRQEKLASHQHHPFHDIDISLQSNIQRAEVRELKFFALECFANQLITESINVGEVFT